MIGRLSFIGVLLVLVSGACAGRSGAAADPPSPAPATPIASASSEPTATATPVTVPLGLAHELASIEDNLLTLDFVMRFDVEAEGAVTARLVGELQSQRDTLTLRATGSFGGNPVDLSLTADGRRLHGSNGTAKLELPQPAALEEAVVVGLVRMGILHNLAVLVAARPPDHAEGGVDEWLQAESVGFGTKVGPSAASEHAAGRAAGAMSFRVMVAGTHSGDCTLWWDSGNKTPVERHQVVRFPDGEMHVRESYTIELLRRDDDA